MLHRLKRNQNNLRTLKLRQLQVKQESMQE